MAERRESVRVTADISNFTTKMAAAGASAKAFARDLDSTDSRMANLVQTGLALGPALVPIGAVAVPAIAALSAGIGVAVLGAGAAVLAFQGMGDALTAANAYAIDPSAANLEKLNETLREIGPAGRDMVVFLQDLKPELEHLQGLAGEGLFPGLQDGIESMMHNLPQVEALISEISSAVGDVAAGAGAGFDSPFWRDFLDFLTTNSRQTMQDFADATGNVAQAMASLWMAFDPLNDSFTAGLVSSTQAFADWSAGLSETQGFQDFTDYLRTSGPQVVDTLASLGNALVQLLEAAAPLGGPTLAAIRAIADTLAAIANSPAGPILISAAAGLSALSRAVALYKVTSGSALIGFLGGASKEGTRAAGGMRLAAAGVGVLALSLTDLDEKLGVSRTLMGAALGSSLGPMGALAGAGIGAVLDRKHVNDELNDSLQLTIDLTAKSLESPLDFAGQDEALKNLQGQAHAIEMLNKAMGGDLQEEVDKGNAAIDAFVAKQNDMKRALSDVGAALDGNRGIADYTGDLDELNDIATNIQPALDSMGISLVQLRDMQGQRGEGFLDVLGNVQFDSVVAGISAYSAAADTAEGRTTSVADAIAALDNPLTTAAQAADSLSAALDALIGPEQGVIAANDAWTTGLRHLADDLSKSNRTLRGNTDAAITNRAAISGRVDLLKEDLVAMARAGVGSERLTARMKDQRQALINAGVAAGISRGELRDYLATMNLTPKMIRTLIANNASSAKQYVDAYGDALSRLDGRVVTTFINTVNRTIGALNPFDGKNADGNIHHFSAGGIPSIGSQQPQIQPNRGPGGIVWAETGAGPWEAFVSGHPAKRGRSRNITDELVHRLGGDVQWMADGGISESAKKAAEEARAQRAAVNAALRSFSINPGDDRQTARSDVRDLIKTLQSTFGHGAEWIKHIDKLGDRVVAATKRQDKMQDALADLTGGLRDLRQARSQFRGEVAGAIDNDVFGNGLAGFNLQLKADRNDNRKMLAALKRARNNGLDGPLLRAAAASGDLAFVEELSRLGRRGIRREEQLYNSRTRAQGDLGQFAANAAYGEDVREQTHEVRQMRRRIDHMTKVIDRQERRMEHAVERGSNRGTRDGMNDRQRRVQARRKAR